MPNMGPQLKALSMRAIASPPVISFACAIPMHLPTALGRSAGAAPCRDEARPSAPASEGFTPRPVNARDALRKIRARTLARHGAVRGEANERLAARSPTNGPLGG